MFAIRQGVSSLRAVVTMAVCLGAASLRADSSRAITIASSNRNADGIIESVDLSFGDCAEDFSADLYVSYGYEQGSSTSYDAGWATTVKLSGETPVTAATTTWHYTMPEGWNDSVRYLRFFFMHEESSNSALGYYVPGMTMCFDAVDNVGKGVDAHDATATYWKDLVTGVERALDTKSVWRDDYSLGFTENRAGFQFAPNGIGRIWTLQIVASGQENSCCFMDGSGDDIWVKWGNDFKFGFRGARFSPSNWNTNETVTLVSAETYLGVFKTSGEWRTAANEVGTKTSSKYLTVGNPEADGNFAPDQRFHSIRVYDRVLTDEEIAANAAVDDARFYGKGEVPALPSGTYACVGSSEMIKRTEYANISVVSSSAVEEVKFTPKVRIDGFELSGILFDIYARIDGGAPVKVKSNVKWFDDTDVPIGDLAPDRDYSVTLFARSRSGDLVSAETEPVVIHTTPVVLHDGKVVESGRSITYANYRSGDPVRGRRGSVDLVFGACSDDFIATLYVGYGSKAGADMAETGWAHWEKVTDEPITAATKTYHYQLPADWMAGTWVMRFYLVCDPARMQTKDQVKDYYVQDGLIAMWDGVDNAGNGVHDDEATVWKDLVGTNDITFTSGISFTTNSITCPTTGASQWGEAAEALAITNQDVTYEAVYRITSGSCIVTVMNAFGNLYLWSEGDWTEFADQGNKPNVTRMPYPGHTVMVQNAVAVSGMANISAYVNGVDSGYYFSDHWYATAKPSIFTEGRGDPLSRDDYRGARGAAGEIFTYRVYNRKLTPDEILHNYNYDCVRFFGKGFPISSSATLYAQPGAGGLLFILK